LTLGVVTLALAYAIEAVWFRNTDIVGTGGARVTPPELFGVDLQIGVGRAFPRIEFGLLCLATLVVVALGVALLRRSALGSAMLAVRANERSAAAAGVNVVRIKVVAFAIASFIAGLGGCLLAYRRSSVTFDSFTAMGGLALLSTGYLAGITSVWGGINAGILASTGITFIALDRWVDLGSWFEVISGVLLIITLISNPEGIAGMGHKLADGWAARRAKRAGRGDAPAERPAMTAVGTAEDIDAGAPLVGAAAADGAADADGAAALEVDHLTVRYGGVVAVNDVSLRVGPGAIVGLIGPNGAGKTSVIDAITGFAGASGSVGLGGSDIAGLAPHARVRAGLARTFQSLELYDDLSVDENVSVAALGGRRSDRHEAVTRALTNVGIADLRHRPAGELSQGERQLVSIARACAAGPSVLLLDEPAAGLDSDESVWLGERLRAIRSAGAAMLLVDHDVNLVLTVCDYVYVLDFGAVIAEGPPDAIRNDRAVAEAYLGTMHDPEAVTA
ncbi:MAG: branched-chain amino acid ABC transporter ATP-binding protein/permease, partial [Acidimicrobiales bacterium]|nr:branched-chain amino acid ABC transporter ATP-binding protein/permease [Acidimicrobiales bacterium]